MDSFLIKGAIELPDKSFKLDNDLLAVKVTFDAEFWSPVLNCLDSFFTKYVATELVYPRLKHGPERLKVPQQTFRLYILLLLLLHREENLFCQCYFKVDICHTFQQKKILQN